MSGRAGYPEFGMEALGGKKESDREEERGKGGQERRRKEKRRREEKRTAIQDGGERCDCPMFHVNSLVYKYTAI